MVKCKELFQKGGLALTNATLITMSGKEIENGTIILKNNRIEKVSKSDEIQLPKDVREINLEGKFIIPGFVDTHAHLFASCLGLQKNSVWSYAANLAYGVTTTRDPQETGTTDVLTYGDMVVAGMIPGPRIYSLDQVLVIGGIILKV